MWFSRKESLLIISICFLEPLIQGAQECTVADGRRGASIAIPAGETGLILFPRLDRESSKAFRAHRIGRNGRFFAYIRKDSNYGQCLYDIDIVLKQFCLLKSEVSKLDKTHLMLKIKGPNANDGGCYFVEWVFSGFEPNHRKLIQLDVIKVRRCALPHVPSTTHIIKPTNYNRTYLTGETITLACKKGFKKKSGGNPVRVCNNGRWTQLQIICQKLKLATCGYSSVNFRFRIVGGTHSTRGMWPWQIGLYGINRGVPAFLCGGALISPFWVLTAAHCFYANSIFNGNPNLYVVKAGDQDRSINETSQQEIVPEKIIVHHDYKYNSSVDADIALIKLSRKVDVNRDIRTVCLPKKNKGDLAIPNRNGIVAGWGYTRSLRLGELVHHNETSTVLRHAVFTIQSDQLCSNKSLLTYNTTIAFCAGDGKGVSDTCTGDSGGAFVRQIKRGSKLHWVAVGIVSWGEGCAQKDKYGYYTRVYPFIGWIRKTMKVV